MDHEYSSDCDENGEAGPCRTCYVVPDDRHIIHWSPNMPTQELEPMVSSIRQWTRKHADAAFDALRFYVPPPEGNPFK